MNALIFGFDEDGDWHDDTDQDEAWSEDAATITLQQHLLTKEAGKGAAGQLIRQKPLPALKGKGLAAAGKPFNTSFYGAATASQNPYSPQEVMVSYIKSDENFLCVLWKHSSFQTHFKNFTHSLNYSLNSFVVGKAIE